MESTEDIQKYMAIAQSLTTDARNLPGINEDPALQQMGALLASNCQKLCIGPSFHFYTSENSQSLIEQSSEIEEPSVNEISDEGEYETVIYKGPDAPYEIVEDNEPKKNVLPNSGHDAMKLKLAQASAEYGGLLSPNFFLHNMSPECSSRTSNPTESSRFPYTAFSFPTTNSNAEVKTGDTATVSDTSTQELQRIEILENAPSEDESEWVEWPKKFIEDKGFCLGVQPGNFYKEASRSRFYVKLPHRSKYEILVTNNNQVPCDLDLYVDGQHSNALRIPAGASSSIDGPQYSKHAFKFFRAQEPPPGKKVREGDRKNGLIKAKFVPCNINSARLRSASEPLRPTLQKDILDLLDEDSVDVKKRAFTVNSHDQDAVERTLDMSKVAEGVTLLQGKKKKREYVIAPEMETDPSKQVILQLRLIASLDEEIAATEEAVYDLEPPPLRKKK